MAPGSPLTVCVCREHYGKPPRSDRSREAGLGVEAERSGEAFTQGRFPSMSHLEHPSNRLLRRRPLRECCATYTSSRAPVVVAASLRRRVRTLAADAASAQAKRPERGLSPQRTRRRVTKQKPSARHKKWRTAGSPSPRCSSPRPKLSIGASSARARTRGSAACTGNPRCRRPRIEWTRPALPWSTASCGWRSLILYSLH